MVCRTLRHLARKIADSGPRIRSCFPAAWWVHARNPIPSVRYFDYFMRTARSFLRSSLPATTNTNINIGILESSGAIPTPAEQRRIVAKVDQLMALVDQLEAQLAASRATATSLMNAMVAELTAEA